MTKYMIELHNVPHEIVMYVEELKMYGEIDHWSERYPTYLWLVSPWDISIFSDVMGVKSIRAPLERALNVGSALKDILTERKLV